MKSEIQTLNLAKVVRFCIDFLIPVPKMSVTAIFKRLSPENPQIGFEQFLELIDKFFLEVNRVKLQELRKGLKSSDNPEELQR